MVEIILTEYMREKLLNTFDDIVVVRKDDKYQITGYVFPADWVTGIGVTEEDAVEQLCKFSQVVGVCHN